MNKPIRTEPVRSEFDNWFWQRLVDGQLTSGELRQLLVSCESRPELWRRCAEAFLEEQALSQSLKATFDESFDVAGWIDDSAQDFGGCDPLGQPKRTELGSSSLSRHNPPIARTDERAVEKSVEKTVEKTIERTAQSSAQQTAESHGSAWFNLLSMAALVLLAFGIGWQASRRAHQSNMAVSNANQGGSLSSATSDSVELASSTVDKAARNNRRLDPPYQPKPAMINPAESPTQSVLVSNGPQGDSRPLTLDDRLPSEFNKLRNLEVGRSYGVVPVTLNGVPALVPLERVEIRAREPY